MPITPITSPDDPRVDDYLRLTDHQLRSRARPEQARMICESRLVLEVALDRGLTPLSLFLDERHLAGADAALAPLVARLPPEVPVYTAPTELMSQITGFTVTRGVLGCFCRPEPATPGQVLAGARRVVVLESIVDTTNVGAIFRSSAALSADAVLVAPTCADPYSRRALRTSMGCVLKVPWARAEAPWPASAIDALHAAGFTCAALALTPGALPLDAYHPDPDERVALFLGTEGTGLTRAAIDACDLSLIIPMHAGVDSLNVATAASVALWHLRP